MVRNFPEIINNLSFHTKKYGSTDLENVLPKKESAIIAPMTGVK